MHVSRCSAILQAAIIASSVCLASTAVFESDGASRGPGVAGLAKLIYQSKEVSSSSLGCKSMTEVINAIDELSVIASILNVTCLLGEFGNPTLKGTFFAPTNNAVLRFLPESTLKQIFTASDGCAGGTTVISRSKAASDALQTLVLLHAIPSALKLRDFGEVTMLPSFLSTVSQLNDGQGLLTVQRSGTALAVRYAGNQAAVIVTDIEACDSVVHIVDSLLLPKPTSAAPPFQPSPEDVLLALAQSGSKSQLAFTGGEQVTFIRTAKPTTAPITGLSQQEPSGNVTLSNLSGSPGGDSNVSTNGEPSTNSG